MGHTTLITPFRGWHVVHRLGLATSNLSAKFEVICTGYEDIKDDSKCRKWGVL